MNDQQVRYGVIGFGRFAEKSLVPALGLSHNSRLVAIQNRSRSKAMLAAARLGISLAFESPQRLAAHPDVDAVIIASPNALHCEHTLIAAEWGKHVLCEKPMAMDAGECERMIEACTHAGVKLMVGHMVRFSPLVRRMRELVLSGSVGHVVRVTADFVYDGRLSTRSWLTDRTLAGGGPTFDVGVHCLDTLRYILDDEVVRVRAELQPPSTAEKTELASQLLLQFSRGTIGTIFSSYEAPFREARIEIVGTEARLSTLDFTLGERRTRLRIERRNAHGSRGLFSELLAIPNLYVEEINHFSDCILHDRTPLLSAENALANQRVLDEVMRQQDAAMQNPHG